MPVHTIALEALRNSMQNCLQARHRCVHLEAGGVLYFPRTPVPIPPADLEFLLTQRQSGSSLHKNIAYKPDRDQLSGVDRKLATPARVGRLHAIMRRYSASIESFLSDFLSPYQRCWRLDYASFRPVEEQGR